MPPPWLSFWISSKSCIFSWVVRVHFNYLSHYYCWLPPFLLLFLVSRGSCKGSIRKVNFYLCLHKDWHKTLWLFSLKGLVFRHLPWELGLGYAPIITFRLDFIEILYFLLGCKSQVWLFSLLFLFVSPPLLLLLLVSRGSCKGSLRKVDVYFCLHKGWHKTF